MTRTYCLIRKVAKKKRPLSSLSPSFAGPAQGVHIFSSPLNSPSIVCFIDILLSSSILKLTVSDVTIRTRDINSKILIANLEYLAYDLFSTMNLAAIFSWV